MVMRCRMSLQGVKPWTARARNLKPDDWQIERDPGNIAWFEASYTPPQLETS